MQKWADRIDVITAGGGLTQPPFHGQVAHGTRARVSSTGPVGRGVGPPPRSGRRRSLPRGDAQQRTQRLLGPSDDAG